MTNSQQTACQKETESELVQAHIRAMHGYAPGEQPPAGKFIKLNTNENPFPPAESVVRAIQQSAAEHLNLYPDPNCLAFRRVAADLYGVDPDWIMCGNGSDDILTILTRTFVGAGDSLRMLNPSYTLYRTLAEIQNARVNVHAYTDDWQLPETFFQAQGDRLAFLPNPNSPSGTFITPTEIAAQIDRLDCPLVVDEAYVDFAEENCVELVRQSEKVIVTRTLSKSYSLAGLRFGFAIAQPQLIRQLMKVKDSYNCDRLSIAGATAAISDQVWLCSTIDKIRQTRGRLSAKLTELGFAVTPSSANFVWCQHTRIASEKLYQDLKARQILVRYMKFADWGDGLRITVGSESQIDALLSILSDLVSQ